MFNFSKGAKKSRYDFSGRRKSLLAFMYMAMLILAVRATYLQIFDKQFLQGQARSRHVSNVKIAAYRGIIKDRNGKPLAVSAPVESVWVNPQFCRVKAGEKPKRLCDELSLEKLQQVATILEIPFEKVTKAFDTTSRRKFLYLKRRINPDLAKKVKALRLAGVGFRRDFKRFYPRGEVTSHLLGFTNIDDKGQEGLELIYDEHLQGVAGKKRVIRDGRRRAIEDYDVESIKEAEAGKDLQLSIDERLQYLAYRELKAAVLKHEAKSGSVVILEAETGDILAMVNQPSFNPNTRKGMQISRYRNRALTDVYEPGSTLKPLVVAAALEGHYITEHQKFNSASIKVSGRWVKDGHRSSIMDVQTVLKKSSNVGASKIALSMPAEYFWNFYYSVGFGTSPAVGFPGEASGFLPEYTSWSKFEQATLSFGYHVSMSTLQLAKAYTALADDGLVHSVSLLKREKDEYADRVLSKETAVTVRTMIESVVQRDGTAYRASVKGYRVAGKTGTVKKAVAGGYGSDYLSLFVGMAPASDPKLVIAVMVDSPSVGGFYGGVVAAPIFSKVMGGALRLLKIPPDDIKE